jgi:hypothetical protein
MANNRMFLVCPCGAEWMLAKSMATGWYIRDGEGYADRQNSWLADHQFCGPRVGGETRFTLEYEDSGDAP